MPRLLLPAAGLALSFVASAPAQVIGYSVQSNGNDHLYAIDLTTGAATDLGLVGLNDAEGIAAVGNDLYAIGGTVAELWNITTPPGSLVGPTGARNGVDAGLEYDPSTATLYNMQGTGGSSSLYTIDIATGAATLVGTNAVFGDGLAIDSSGQAYTADFIFQDGLYTVDLNTGAATFVGGFNIGNVSLQAGLAFDGSDVLWAITSGGAIYSIDTATGAATFSASVSVGGGWEGLAILDTGVVFHGSGCRDSLGSQLRMRSSGQPILGSNFGLRCEYGAAVPYLLIGGLSDQNWLGIVLPIDLTPAGANGCSIYTSQEIQAGLFSAGTGLNVQIPRDPTLNGGVSHWQALVFDPGLGGGLPLATSNYATVTLRR